MIKQADEEESTVSLEGERETRKVMSELVTSEVVLCLSTSGIVIDDFVRLSTKQSKLTTYCKLCHWWACVFSWQLASPDYQPRQP